MTDTNQLPEPELGYIKTDKSNQPAFSARQMREAMQARAQATQAEVTDEQLNAVALEQWGPHTGGPLAAHRAFARAILALRTERVPMTREQMIEAVRPLCISQETAESLVEISFDEYRAIEAFHNIGITAQPKGVE